MTLNLSQDGRVIATGLEGMARGETHLECVALVRNHGRPLSGSRLPAGPDIRRGAGKSPIGEE